MDVFLSIMHFLFHVESAGEAKDAFKEEEGGYVTSTSGNPPRPSSHPPTRGPSLSLYLTSWELHNLLLHVKCYE